MKVITVVGARPQFIKAAPVSIALNELGIKETLLHTGQHYDYELSELIFDQLGLSKPKYNLNCGSNTQARQTASMMEGIENVLLNEKTDAMLVYGDTNSTLAAALVASKLNIPVHHIEAGLRSFNNTMPEEINRIVTDRISNILFAPTKGAMKNLTNEGLSKNSVNVGDVMFDALSLFKPYSEEVKKSYNSLEPRKESYVLITIHRASNVDCGRTLTNIVTSFKQLSKKIPIIWPVHPRTSKKLKSLALLDNIPDQLIITKPAGYLEMLQLEKNAKLIVTDSGGVQKEAYFCRVPCITLRSETEWKELVDAGWNILIEPNNMEAFEASVENILSGKIKTNNDSFPYGDGNAAKKIASFLINYS